MAILRTPDNRFDNLPGYDFLPNYIDDLPGYEGMRVHYLDEGRYNENQHNRWSADTQEVALCLHGQPTWSYLYRKMIPQFVAHGIRVIAPDLLGFGKSDKPDEDGAYSFDFHREMLLSFVERLDLHRVTLVCQDWGGILGLTLPQAMPERFERLLVMNTTIPVGEPVSEGFAAWRNYNKSQNDLPIGDLMRRSVIGISDGEAAAYDAPFPDATFKAGVRRFPELVMTHPDAPGVETTKAAARWWSQEWNGKSFMVVGMEDPVLGPEVMARLEQTIKGDTPVFEINNAGHFVQESDADIVDHAMKHFK